jgi:hypothetical protein
MPRPELTGFLCQGVEVGVPGLAIGGPQLPSAQGRELARQNRRRSLARHHPAIDHFWTGREQTIGGEAARSVGN